MRATIQQIDNSLEQVERQDTIITSGSPPLTRQLTLWHRSDLPIKLTLTEPNEFGGMTEESSFWFQDGELRSVIRPFDGFYFEDNRILLWTDGTLEPFTEVSRESRDQEENQLLAELREWLAVFDIELP